MYYRIVTSAVLFCTFALWPAAAPAADPHLCNTRAIIVEALAGKFHELPIATALAGGNLLEVLTSDDSSTWTIIVSTPGGVTCVILAGESWQTVEKPALGDAL
jgi:hypothetical protein